MFDLASDHSCCKPSTTVVVPLLLLIDCCKRSATVGTCCLRRCADDAQVEQETGHAASIRRAKFLLNFFLGEYSKIDQHSAAM